jgi:dTDP-4-amino-4,6-dideoxygalactose transaminase
MKKFINWFITRWRKGSYEMRVYITSGECISSELANPDKIMNDTLCIGVYVGMTEEMLDFVCVQFETFLGVNF